MNQEYFTIIIRQLEGSIRPEEDKKLQQWLNLDPENRLFFEQIKQHWEGNSHLQEDFEEQPAWERLSNQLDLHRDQEKIILPKPAFKLNWQWSGIAAVFAGFLMVSSLMYWWFFMNSTLTYSTNPGQITTIWLPDSSLVTLFENSELAYHKSSGQREVTLKGEAFFDVKKQNGTPFLVKTSHFNIRVLGTSFNVKSYQQDEKTETTLIEGRVEISSKDETGKVSEKQILQPQQKAIYSKKTQQMEVIIENEGQLNQLAEGSLVFSNERLGKVLEVMSREHKITINTENSRLNRCTITADFSHQSLEVAMQLLCELIEASYRNVDGEIFISGEGC